MVQEICLGVISEELESVTEKDSALKSVEKQDHIRYGDTMVKKVKRIPCIRK